MVLVWPLTSLHRTGASCLSQSWQRPVCGPGRSPGLRAFLNVILGTGQFLQSLANVLGDSLSSYSAQSYLSTGRELRGEVGRFLQVRHGLEKPEKWAYSSGQ